MPRNPTRHTLVVAESLCIGCLACSRVCPEGAITVRDREGRRHVLFSRNCQAEACDRCVAACPEQALSLRPLVTGEEEPPLRLEFELSRCWRCSRPMTTVRMMAKLMDQLLPRLQATAETQDWLRLCPRCRRQGQSTALVHGVRRQLDRL